MTASINKGRSASLYPNLGKVTAELRELRIQSHRARYGGGSLPDLPSRKAIIEIVNGLTAALFPRHFGPAGLTGESPGQRGRSRRPRLPYRRRFHG